MLAGPNGAGKSTFFDVFLRPEGFRFVNAALIARSLTGDDEAEIADRAAALADVERRALVARGDTFVMETVFSDPHGAKLSFLEESRAAGYRVAFVLIGLDGPELCGARVAQRVLQGGHDVPDEKVAARFPRTLENARRALHFADSAWVFDNGDAERPYRLVARLAAGAVIDSMPPLPAWCAAILP